MLAEVELEGKVVGRAPPRPPACMLYGWLLYDMACKLFLGVASWPGFSRETGPIELYICPGSQDNGAPESRDFLWLPGESEVQLS